MWLIIIYCMRVLSSQMSQVLKATTTRYPNAGCLIKRICHQASSNKCLFVGMRFSLAVLSLLLIPLFIFNNLALNIVYAEQLHTVKKIYGENGKQEIVEISLSETEVKVVSGSKGKVYSIDTNNKSERIVASIEVINDSKNGVVYAKITGKSNTINIKQGDYVKFLPSQADVGVHKPQNPKKVKNSADDMKQGSKTVTKEPLEDKMERELQKSLPLKAKEPVFTTTPTIAAGYYHTIVLKSDGTVWAWGDNTNGQLGDGTKTNRTIPVQVKEINSVVTITSKENSTLAQKADSSFWIWGNDALMQCEKPKMVNETQNTMAIGSLLNHPIYLKADGTIWIWHEGPIKVDNLLRIETEPPVLMRIKGIDNVTAIVCRGNYQVALKSDGTLWNLQSGEIIIDYNQKTFSIVPNQIYELNDVIAISGERTHAIALKRDGTVWACGNNTDSELGDGTATNRLQVQVKQIQGTIQSSYLSTITPTNISPVQVKGLNNIVAIAGGGYHTVVLKSDGTVWTWGDNNYGQLGIGTTIDTSSPVQVKSLGNITAIAAGMFHTVVLKSDGTVFGMGDNRYGQLGDGTNTNRNLPVQVVNVNLGNVALSQSSIKP